MIKRVTLADVAEKVGMSRTAVSLVLNDRPGTRISPEAGARIREAAEQLGYRPNPAARSLRVGKTRTIGFLSDDVTVTRFASAMIRGLLDVAEEHEHTVLIAETGSNPKRVRAALDVMLDRQPDGLIIGLMGAKESDVPALTGKLPVVLLNGTSPGVRTCVLPDEFEAGRTVAHHLADRGHTAIALLGDHEELRHVPRISATIGRRFAGVEAGLAERGLALAHAVVQRNWEPEDGYAAARTLLDHGPAVTAVIAANDRMAFGTYQAIQEAGLRIPQDLSVISFDDEFIARSLRPPLTSARLPYEEMGRRAMELVLAPTRPTGELLIEMPLQVRASGADLTSGTGVSP